MASSDYEIICLVARRYIYFICTCNTMTINDNSRYLLCNVFFFYFRAFRNVFKVLEFNYNNIRTSSFFLNLDVLSHNTCHINTLLYVFCSLFYYTF